MVSCSRDAPPGASAVFRAVLYLSIYLSIYTLGAHVVTARGARGALEWGVVSVRSLVMDHFFGVARSLPGALLCGILESANATPTFCLPRFAAAPLVNGG